MEGLQQQLARLAARRQQVPAQEDEQQPWQFSQQHHFDPADCGSYPCRQQLHALVWRDLAACHQAVAQGLAQHQAVQTADGAGPAVGTDVLNPFGWVPDVEVCTADDNAGCLQQESPVQQQISSVRPKTAQIRSRTATSLPLEYFDSSEMERVDIQQRLDAAEGQEAGGLQALSRFYSPDGAFSWQPCTVLQYDR